MSSIKATYKVNGIERNYYFYCTISKSLTDKTFIEDLKNGLPEQEGVTDFKVEYEN